MWGRIRFRVLVAREHGQSMVEFALTLPMLLLIVTSICAFGITIAHYMIITDAADVGGRQLAILRNNSLDPCADVTSTIRNASPTLTPSGKNGLSISFMIENNTYGTSCPGVGALMTAGDKATVTINYPCSLAVFGRNFASVCNLQAQTTELVQ